MEGVRHRCGAVAVGRSGEGPIYARASRKPRSNVGRSVPLRGASSTCPSGAPCASSGGSDVSHARAGSDPRSDGMGSARVGRKPRSAGKLGVSERLSARTPILMHAGTD